MKSIALGVSSVFTYRLVNFKNEALPNVSILIHDEDSVIPDVTVITDDNGYFNSLNTYTGDIRLTANNSPYNDLDVLIDSQTASFPQLVNMTIRICYRVRKLGEPNSPFSNTAIIDL